MMKRWSVRVIGVPLVVLTVLVCGSVARAESSPTDEADRLRQVAQRGADPLAAVSERMAEAKLLLEKGRVGTELQSLQGEILQRMDGLIRLYESSEAASRRRKARSQTPGRMPGGMGTERPVRPAEESIAGEGQWEWSRPLPPEPPAGEWAPSLPEAERQKISDTFRVGRLPARYRELLRQYNRRLARAGPGVEESDD